MGRILILLAFLGIFMFLFEWLFKKTFGIQSKSISDTTAKKINLFGRIIIVLVFIVFLLPMGIDPNATEFKWYWLALFIAQWGFQGWLEWMYLRETKQHIISIVYLILSVVFVLNIEHVLDFLNLP